MSRWVLTGLSRGIITTKYPKKKDKTPGITPGIPVTYMGNKIYEKIIEICPTNAIYMKDNIPRVDISKCIHCLRCIRHGKDSISWAMDYEWAQAVHEHFSLPSIFKKSAHIRVVDAGDCGACLNEVKLLNNPYYNMHRLGFFYYSHPKEGRYIAGGWLPYRTYENAVN